MGLIGRSQDRGFTLIELVITISVIAILATISIVGYSQYQAGGRDATRQSRAIALTEALEKYYDTHGEYPSCSQLTQAPDVVSESVLVGVDTSALKAPNGDNNAITCSDLTNVNSGDYFAYIGDTSEACVGTNGNACVLFTFKYIQEGEGEVAEIDSRRRTPLVASQIPNLTTTTASFTGVNTSWTATDGAVSYTLQYSTTLSFPLETAPSTASSGTITTNGTTLSSAVNSLSYGTLYYFRIKAANATAPGGWSATKTATTQSLATPTLTSTAAGFYSIGNTWTSVTHATSYTLQYSTGAFPSEAAGNTATSGTITTSSLSSTVASLSYGTSYNLRVKATAATSPVHGSWSTTRTASTWIIGTPAVSCGSVTTGSMVCSWSAASNATSYDFQTRVNGGAWSAVANQATLSRTLSNGTQGTQLQIQVRSVNGSITSSWSAIAGTTLSVATPAWNRFNQTAAYPSWSSWIDRVDGAALCASGMNLYSQFRDGVAPGWNAWGAFSNRGTNATSTAVYASTIANYTSTLQVQLGAYCRNETTGAVSSTIQSSVYTAIHSAPPVLSGPQSCVGPYDIRPMFDLVLTLNETSMNVGANTSVVTWTAYRRANGNLYNTWNATLLPQHQHNVVIHGSSRLSGQSASQRFRYAYATWSTEALHNNSSANVNTTNTGSFTVNHNADGTATIAGSISDTFNGQVFGTASCSLNYTLSDLR